MSTTPQRDVAVGGCLPPSASRSRPSPARFAVDAVDAHSHLNSSGPILSTSSPVVSRSRRSQPSSQATTPATHHASALDAGVDVRASVAALAAVQPGRFAASVAGAEPAAALQDGEIGPVENWTDADADAMEEAVQPLPLRPVGRMLLINCFTNWGDPHFIGLAGIDVFDTAGNIVEVRRDHTFTNGNVDGAEALCDAAWMNPGNLSTRPHNTTDPNRMWLASYHPGAPHAVVLLLPETMAIALIRVWNYNSGRVHASRGARLVEITLDDHLVFRGELRPASGLADTTAPENNAETLVFTDDEPTLERIARRLEQDAERDVAPLATAAASETEAAAVGGFASCGDVREALADSVAPTCSSISIQIASTWGNPVVVGLSALRVLDVNGDDVEDLCASVEVPQEYAAMFSTATSDVVSGGSTPLAALFDADPTTAWFARLVPGLTLRIDLPRPTAIAGLLIANAGIFDIDCGAHTVSIALDRSQVIASDLVLRKAPASLPALLFQRIRFSDLLTCTAQGATVASSVAARAAVGLRRAGMLQVAWPQDYEPHAATVSFLPVGYTITVRLELVPDPLTLTAAAGDSASDIVTINRLRLHCSSDAPSDAKPTQYFAAIPPSAAAGASPEGPLQTVLRRGTEDRLVLVYAHEAPQCLEGLEMNVAAVGHRQQCDATLVCTVLVDDQPVFSGAWPSLSGVSVVLPFTRNAKFLEAHRAALYRSPTPSNAC